MQKYKKIIILVIIVLILITSGIVIGTSHLIELQRGQQDIMGLERREREAYVRQNYAFLWGEITVCTERLDQWGEGDIEHLASFRPFGGHGLNSRFGINTSIYLSIKMYELETENILTWETVVDYFSQEFEPDGSLRLYNNGNHPEIQGFVEWMVEGDRGGGASYRMHAWQFIDQIENVFWDYSHANENFDRPSFQSISSQMLDALVRAYTDPDYVLDLTSLQQAGY